MTPITIHDAILKRIDELCEETGISKYQMRYNCALPRSTYKALIKGRTKTSTIATINLICIGFHTDLRHFFDSPLFEECIINDDP